MKTSTGFAVLELFTSQGCSCPSADENLGWRDPFSTADATKRQRLYAGVHGSKQVYTPLYLLFGIVRMAIER